MNCTFQDLTAYKAEKTALEVKQKGDAHALTETSQYYEKLRLLQFS